MPKERIHPHEIKYDTKTGTIRARNLVLSSTGLEVPLGTQTLTLDQNENERFNNTAARSTKELDFDDDVHRRLLGDWSSGKARAELQRLADSGFLEGTAPTQLLS